jgi:hypothetical protein
VAFLSRRLTGSIVFCEGVAFTSQQLGGGGGGGGIENDNSKQKIFKLSLEAM